MMFSTQFGTEFIFTIGISRRKLWLEEIGTVFNVKVGENLAEIRKKFQGTLIGIFFVGF
jgi:hypothetical protein